MVVASEKSAAGLWMGASEQPVVMRQRTSAGQGMGIPSGQAWGSVGWRGWFMVHVGRETRGDCLSSCKRLQVTALPANAFEIRASRNGRYPCRRDCVMRVVSCLCGRGGCAWPGGGLRWLLWCSCVLRRLLFGLWWEPVVFGQLHSGSDWRSRVCRVSARTLRGRRRRL